MLTRLQVQGFKNLLDVDVEFGPFTCIAGANGMGKSNLFDAIEFLSYLATDSLTEAALRVRGLAGSKGGDPRDLFWDGYREHEHRIKIAAEMIVPAEVEDELGERARPAATYLRYEVLLSYESSRGEHSVGRLHLLREDLRQIPNARARLAFPAAAAFLDTVLIGEDRDRVFLSTDGGSGNERLINVHDHRNRVEKSRPAGRVVRTVLSTKITADDPTLLAARNEMRSWRRLALEPSALRTPDGTTGAESLATNGRHLPATLYRVAHGRDWSVEPDRVYARVAGRLSDLSGVAVEDLTVEFDEARELFTLFLRERGAYGFPHAHCPRAPCVSSRSASSWRTQSSPASSAWRNRRTASTRQICRPWCSSSATSPSTPPIGPATTIRSVKSSSTPTRPGWYSSAILVICCSLTCD